MSEPARLRVVECEGCERRQRQLDAITIDLENAEVSLRAERSSVRRLKNELDGKRRHSKDYTVAERIFEFWREKTGHTRAEFLEKRQKAVLHAMKHLTPRECCMAVLGCVHGGFTDPHTKEKRDELAMILRDEEMWDKNLQRYETYCSAAGVLFERGPSLAEIKAARGS